MLSHQFQQLDTANSTLEQIQGVITAAQSELQQLQTDIKSTRREHDLQIARLKKAYQQKVKKIRKNFAALSEDLQSNITILQQTLKNSIAEKGLIEYEISELGHKTQRQRQEYIAARKDNAEELLRLKESIKLANGTLRSKESKLTQLDVRIANATKQVEHFEKLLVQNEESYAKRATELLINLLTAETKLEQTERLIQEYEMSMAVTREADEARRIDLERRENLLAAGKRALFQNRADFDIEKKRFYQTKSL